MRIASGVTDQYVYFVAIDSTDLKTRETGLSSFTVYRSRDGAAAVAMTTPTINETDSSNMPGVYELLLDEDMTIGAGNDTEEICFHITHAGMAPVTRVIELYRPKITVGATATVTSGVISADAVQIDSTAQRATDLAEIAQYLFANAVALTDVIADTSVMAKLLAVNGDISTYNEITDSQESIRNAITALNNVSTAEVNAECDTALSDWDKTGFALTAGERTSIADAVLSRGVSNVEATADEHSLCTVVLATLESSISGVTWTIRKTDGTTFTTKTLTTDDNAAPVTGVT